MVDVSPNPIDPPVPLRLCARKIDYLKGDSGTLLIGTSVNSVVMIRLTERDAADYMPEVILESHTGNLRALASLPSASLCFSVSLEVLSQDLSVVAKKEDEGHLVKDVALRLQPSLETTERSSMFIEQGRLIVSRFDKVDKKWLRFDPFGVGGGEFVEQTDETNLFLWDPNRKDQEEDQDDAAFAQMNMKVAKIGDEGKLTQGRAKVTITRKLATTVQKNLKPNQRYAALIGNYLVPVRTIDFETDPLSLPRGPSRKQKLRMHQAVSFGEREKQKVIRGDVFTMVGAFDVKMQKQLRRATSNLTGTRITCKQPHMHATVAHLPADVCQNVTGVAYSAVTVQKIAFLQQMPKPDPKDGLIKSVPKTEYQVMLRLNVPIHREERVSDQIYKALGARKVSPWVYVRNLVRKGNFAIEASGRRVGKRTRTADELNDFEIALENQVWPCVRACMCA